MCLCTYPLSLVFLYADYHFYSKSRPVNVDSDVVLNYYMLYAKLHCFVSEMFFSKRKVSDDSNNEQPCREKERREKEISR